MIREPGPANRRPPRPPRRGPWEGEGPWPEQQREWRRQQRAQWREAQHRLRAAHRMQRRSTHRPWYARTAERGFGCLFGLLFLVFVAAFVTTAAAVLSTAGPLPALIVVAVVVIVLAYVGRTLALAAVTLDRLVAAVRAVEAGDYSVRLERVPRQPMRAVTELTRGFDTMAARLEADEEQRRMLLADVSHELRTPLTVIAGNLEAILDGVHPADPEHLEPVLEETRVMERLIEDLRTLTLSEAGSLPLHREPTDLAVLVDEVARSFAPRARAAEVTLTAEAPDDLPLIEVDPVRIREVLANLTANALGHTPAGEAVALAVALEPGAQRVVLTVRDTGPGIDPDLLDHVFDRFVKDERSRGSGLGLAICRGLVEAHGGSITASSPPGEGATFRVVLPIEQEA